MTRLEFNHEFKEVCAVFKNIPPEAYVDRLFQKCQRLNTNEFKIIKARIFDECERFPTIAKFIPLINWLLDKREEKNVHTIFNYDIYCKECFDTGFQWVVHNRNQVWVYCRCDEGKAKAYVWDLDIPFIHECENVNIKKFPVLWFRPEAGETREDKTKAFTKEIQDSAAYWSERRF